MPLIGGIDCAAIDIGDDFLVGVQFQEHLPLKGEAFLFRFDACPCVIVRFFSTGSIFGIAVQLGVVGVMSDGAGVPDGGMPPGRRADGERRFLGPCFHPAAPTLADDGDVILRRSEHWARLKKPQRLASAHAKRGASPNLDAIDEFRLPATEDFHEGGTETRVEKGP